jgi:dTDP-D-glucose 4,6-dehydratase
LNEKPNLEVVRTLCAVLDRECPRADGKSYAEQITFVKDRPGAPDAERTIRWDDPELQLPWPTGMSPILAAKDAAAPTFATAEVFA